MTLTCLLLAKSAKIMGPDFSAPWLSVSFYGGPTLLRYLRRPALSPDVATDMLRTSYPSIGCILPLLYIPNCCAVLMPEP